MITTTTAEPGTLLRLDARELSSNGNVRSKIKNLAALTTSVLDHGVLVPLLVADNGEGGYKVVAGQRRTAAAIAAGKKNGERFTVPCLVVDEGAEANRILTQLTENLSRDDLSEADAAAAYQQLALLGIGNEQIARAVGRDAKHVAAGLKVAESKTATAVAVKHDLTIEQAAVIAEFEADKDAVKRLTLVAVEQPDRFAHTASWMREDRNEKAAIAALIEKIKASGVPYVEISYNTDTKKPMTLEYLVDGKGKAITPAAHKKCEGHAETVQSSARKPVVVGVCMAPAKHGHKYKYAGQSSGRATETPAARTKRLTENREWKAAHVVRREFVRSLLARKTLPKGMLAFAIRQQVGAAHDVNHADENLCDLLGIAKGKGKWDHVGAESLRTRAAKAKSDTELTLLLFVSVAAEAEFSLDTPSRGEHEYLAFLQSIGYTLADVEQALVTKRGK